MSISSSARMTRTAISPRLATRTFENMRPETLVPGDHPGAHRLVRRDVDEDERAGAAEAVVRVCHDGVARAQAHAADGVERQLGRRALRERRDVELVLDRLQPGRDGAGRVLEQV